MRTLRAWLLRLGGLFGKERRDRELAEEMESHLQMHIEDNLRSGMTPEQARREALIKLGGVEQTKENYRDRRGLPWLETLLQDVRFGLRMLGKSPGLTAIVAITLGLGIGANTLIFSIVNGFLLRPLPVPHPEQITVLAAQQKGSSPFLYQFSYPAVTDFRKQGDPFSDVFAYGVNMVGLSAEGRAGQVLVSYVTGNYFSALGVKPALGRLLLPSEEDQPGDELLLVLGYSYWQKRFGGDAGVIGKQVRVNGKSATIIGVAPKEFHGVLSVLDMDGYVPVSTAMTIEQPSSDPLTDRSARGFRVLGRLKPGVSLAQAQSSVNVIAERLARQYPATDTGVSVRVYPERLARPQPVPNSPVPAIAGLFLVLAGLVLLLACMNVANILLVRATVRQREMGIRAALGASRGRLIRQVLTEASLLALLGGFAGVILGWLSNPGTVDSTHLGTSLPLYMDYSFDWRVFAYALAAAVLTGIVVGVWPAVRAARADVSVVLHEGGRSDSAGAGRHRVRNILVVAQVAGSVMLLIAAGLFVRSLEHAQKMYLGFDPDHVLNAVMDPHELGYDPTRTNEFYRELEARVRALPGVQSASLAFSVPMGTSNNGGPVYVEGRPISAGEQPPMILYNNIDPSYFETMRAPLLRGRLFAESDNETAPPVAIVNQNMANKFWPHEDPIGKRFSIKSATGPFMQVVGVAGDGKYNFIAEPPASFFFVPFAQNYTSKRTLQIRSSVPPESLIAQVQLEVRNLAPDLPIFDVQTMRQSLEGVNGLTLFRTGAKLAAQMGLVGLILAVIGVYGVVSYAAAQRTHEIGIRMALGADRADILKLVLRQGLRLAIAGVLAGLVAAWALTRAMANLLVGVSSTDPVTYATVVIVVSGVALLACWIPARRAMRVDPMVALRYE